MTKDENAGSKTENKPAAEREKGERQRGQKKDKVKAPTKIIIRHLPPTMTEDEFLEQIDPLPDHDFYYFAAADWSLGFDATCRAYITLKNYEDVFLFRDRFDGYVFVDSKGAEYPAIVEFAPFQGLLKNKSRRTDNKVNMIEQEEHYQQFLVKLEEDREAAAKGGECKLEFSLDRKKEEKITSTPLLQYLANKKEKRREEAKKRTEEKRRQREEEKEKRRQTQQGPVTKIYCGQEGGETDGKPNATGNKDSVGDKGDNGAQEERKNSRSKRRIERDRRRRAEHEERKKERERQEQERKERAPAKPEKKRERNRNRKDKDKEKEKDKECADEAQSEDIRKVQDREENTDTEAKAKDEAGDAPTKVQEEEVAAIVGKGESVSESVLSFIRSAVTAMEFVPRHKQERSQEDSEPTTPLESGTKMKDAKESKEYYRSHVGDGAERQKSGHAKQGESSTDVKTRGSKLTQKQRSAEERRIRNKDRPSIAIYQPKARLRVSEESDTSASKEVRSNPTSDCESNKKVEQRIKKVSRYSERRSERFSNIEKQNVGETGAPETPSSKAAGRRDSEELAAPQAELKSSERTEATVEQPDN